MDGRRKYSPVTKYGKEFPGGTSRLDIELWCLRHDRRGDYERGRLSSADHFKNAVDIIFNNKNSTRKHVWSPWSENNISAFLGDREAKRFVGIAGASSGGKSNDAALFAVMMYLSAPTETFVTMTSTTLTTAGHRIWKAIREYWSQIENWYRRNSINPPGKMVDSLKTIKGLNKAGEFWDGSGLCVIAADKNAGEDSGSKLKGMKAPDCPHPGGMFILIADELPDISYNVVSNAYTNLVNNAQFIMIALGNPDLKLDAFGRFCKPKRGWSSVSDKSEWETDRGRVICYNSEENPRVLMEDQMSDEERRTYVPKYGWMPTREIMLAAERDYGRNSRAYCGMYLGKWSDEKDAGAIYSETELMDCSNEEEPEWDNPSALVRICSLDSAFTSGGDRNVNIEGLCGRVAGVKHLHVARTSIIDIDDDNKQLPPSHQIAVQWVKNARMAGITPQHAGYDNSGAGISFGHIVDMEWSPSVKKINFGGSPSGRKYSLDGDTGIEYANRVSELWVQPKKFIRAGQISGIPSTISAELVSRKYAEKQIARKVKIETKKEIKKRIGRSCDMADSFVILVEVAIQNGLLDSVEEQTIIRKERTKWKENKPSSLRFGRLKSRQLKF